MVFYGEEGGPGCDARGKEGGEKTEKGWPYNI